MIYCFGDSFTYGVELADKSCAWPHVLSKKLSQPIENFGIAGASNDTIARTVVEKVLDNRPDFVIVSWTIVTRYEFYTVHHGCRNINAHHATRFPFAEKLFAEWHDDVGKTIHWIGLLTMLENFLQNQGVDYIFATSLSNAGFVQQVRKCKNKSLRKWADMFDRSFLERCFMNWCKGMPLGPGGHPLEQGHEAIAEKMHDYIRNSK